MLTDELRRLISESGFTYRELARRTGLHYTALYRCAKGERAFSQKMVDTLVKYFGLEIKRKENAKPKPKVVRRVT